MLDLVAVREAAVKGQRRSMNQASKLRWDSHGVQNRLTGSPGRAARLAFIARFNLLYEPDMLADRAWPLMKLGRYKEARDAAAQGGLGVIERMIGELEKVD